MSDIQPLAKGEYLFTSESVTEGHPDKVCDQISDAVLDAVMAEDPKGRVACETLVNTGMAVVSGEISTDVHLDVPEIVRETIREMAMTTATTATTATTSRCWSPWTSSRPTSRRVWMPHMRRVRTAALGR